MRDSCLLRWSGFLLPYAAVSVGIYFVKNVWVALAVYYIGIMFFAAVNGWRELLSTVTKGWDWPAGLVVSSMFALGGVVVFLFWPFAKLDGIELAGVLSDYGLARTEGLLFAAVAVVMNPFLEELFWRGCFEAKATKLSVIDVAFAGYHAPALAIVINLWAVVVAVAVLCFASWVLRFVKDRCGGLAVCCIAHMAADVSIVSGVYCLLR